MHKDFTLNRMANSGNMYQGKFKKVLCVCSAGLLRSPTAAVVLSQEPFNYNTRAAGAVSEYALVAVDKVLLEWADEIVCMEQRHSDLVQDINGGKLEKKVIVLDIPDRFPYRDSELVKMISSKYLALESK